MKVLITSGVCSANTFNRIFESCTKKRIIGSSQNYYSLLIKGLQYNNVDQIQIISELPVSHNTHRKMIWRRNNIVDANLSFIELSFINLPILKNIMIFLGCLIQTRRWAISHKNDSIVISDCLSFSSAFAARIIARLYRIKTIGVITDLPESFANINREVRTPIKKVAQRIYDMFSIRNYQSYDGYILISENMKHILTRRENLKVDYLIIDCIVDYRETPSSQGPLYILDQEEIEHSIKRIVYAGSLNKKYGLDVLLDSIDFIPRRDVEFQFYGDGDYVSNIIKKSLLDDRIKYFGVVPNGEVLAAEEQASILINPRRNCELFSKYCFPSKIAEYMCSNVPVLCYKLEGVGDEYDKYLNYIIGNSSRQLAGSILKMLDDLEEAKIKASLAKKFIIEKRNYKVQGRKLCEYMEKLLHE